MSDQELEDFEKELLAMQLPAMEEDKLDDALLKCFSGEIASTALPPLKEEFLDELELQAHSAELEAYEPAQLREDLLDTLTLAPVEAELAEIPLPPLSETFLSQLTQAAEATEKGAISEKVIPFPTAEETNAPRQKAGKNGSSWKWFSSAAAVAILGLFLGYNTLTPPENTPAVAKAGITPFINTQPTGSLLNVSTNSTVINAIDQGLVPNKEKTEFYRAMRVTSMETVTIENNEGEKVEVEGPVTRIIYVPAQTD